MWQTRLTVLPDLSFSKYLRTFGSFLKAWAPEVLETWKLLAFPTLRRLLTVAENWLKMHPAGSDTGKADLGNHHLLVLILLFLDHPHWVSPELQFLVWLVGEHNAHRKVFECCPTDLSCTKRQHIPHWTCTGAQRGTKQLSQESSLPK